MFAVVFKAFNQTVQGYVVLLLRASHVSQASVSKSCGRNKKRGNVSSLRQSRAAAEISIWCLVATPLPQLEVGCGKLGGRKISMSVPGEPFCLKELG